MNTAKSIVPALAHLNVPSDCTAGSLRYTLKDALNLIRTWLSLDEEIEPCLFKDLKEMSEMDEELVGMYKSALNAVREVVIEFNMQVSGVRGELKSLKAALQFLESYDGQQSERGVAKLKQIDTGKLQLTQEIDRLLVVAVEAFTLLDTKCKQCCSGMQARLESSIGRQIGSLVISVLSVVGALALAAATAFCPAITGLAAAGCAALSFVIGIPGVCSVFTAAQNIKVLYKASSACTDRTAAVQAGQLSACDVAGSLKQWKGKVDMLKSKLQGVASGVSTIADGVADVKQTALEDDDLSLSNLKAIMDELYSLQVEANGLFVQADTRLAEFNASLRGAAVAAKCEPSQ